MFFYSLEIIGTIFFAMSGALSACRKQYDLSSVLVIAFFVGNGGGTLRDLLIGATPVFWIQDINYIIFSVIAGCCIFLIGERVDFDRKAFLFADAVGMGIFAIAGAEKTLSLHLSPLVAIMMGVMTAVGGGVLRDILCGDEPLIFKPQIYATAALVGAAIFVVSYTYFPYPWIGSLGCILAVVLLRLASIQYGWKLPTVSLIDYFLKK
jgi:uncharacterized membrane protein YeiH